MAENKARVSLGRQVTHGYTEHHNHAHHHEHRHNWRGLFDRVHTHFYGSTSPVRGTSYTRSSYHRPASLGGLFTHYRESTSPHKGNYYISYLK